jgi:hypothetical protein
MKKLILTLAILLVASSLLADTVYIPFACDLKATQKIFRKYGKKVDLRPEDRTYARRFGGFTFGEDSWGFLRSEGMKISIHTYQPVTSEDLEIIRYVILGYREY